MFAVLSPFEVKKARGVRRRRAPCTRITVDRAKNGMPFYTVGFPCVNGEIRWDEVMRTALACAPRLMVPAGLTLPEKYREKLFFPAEGVGRLVFSLAVQLIKAAGIDPCRLTVTAVDPAGVLSGEIIRLLPLASEICVVTEKSESFGGDAQRAMKEFGAALLFPSKIPQKGIVIRLPCRASEGGEYSVISAGGFVPGVRAELTGSCAERLPEGVDPLCFAGALLQLCGEDPAPGELIFHFHTRDGCLDRIQTAKALARAAEKAGNT